MKRIQILTILNIIILITIGLLVLTNNQKVTIVEEIEVEGLHFNSNGTIDINKTKSRDIYKFAYYQAEVFFNWSITNPLQEVLTQRPYLTITLMEEWTSDGLYYTVEQFYTLRTNGSSYFYYTATLEIYYNYLIMVDIGYYYGIYHEPIDYKIDLFIHSISH